MSLFALLILAPTALVEALGADLPSTNHFASTNLSGSLTNSQVISNRMADLRRRARRETLTNGPAAATNAVSLPSPDVAAGTNTTQAAVKAVPLPLPSPLPLPGSVATNSAVPPLAVGGPPNRPFPQPSKAATNRTAIANLPGDDAGNPNILGAPGALKATSGTGYNANDIIEAGSVDLESDLSQFLDFYQKLAQKTVIRASTLPSPPKLYLHTETDLSRKEAVEAMDAVLAQNGITMLPLGDKFVKAVPSLTAQQEGAAISQLSGKELPEADQFITRIVKLKTTKPSEVAPLFATFSKSPTAVTPIDSNNTLVLRDYASNVKRMLEIIERVDVSPESDFKLEVMNIKYGKVEDIYATMSALISGSGGGGGAGAIPGAGAAQRQGANRGNQRGFGGSNQSLGNSAGYGSGGFNNSLNTGNRFGQNYYPESEMIEKVLGKMEGSANYYPQQVANRPVGTTTGSVAANTGSFQNRLNNVVRGAGGQQQQPDQVLESANIVPDYRSNRLLIFANKRDMEMITNIVSKVDTLLAQVLIEAIILEVEIGDSQNVGVTMSSQRRVAGDFNGAVIVNNPPTTGGLAFLNAITNLQSSAPGGFSYVGQIGDDLNIVVNAIASTSTTKVVSRPRIQTSHAIPGSFFLGQTLPYVTGSTDYGAYATGTGLASRSTVSQVQVGFGLNVTPFITPEGLVVMEISQTFDTVGRNVIIDNNPIPIINNRTAESTLTVRTGDTIMMGGFIKDQRDKNNSGIPILKDIPGLGVLFRSKGHNNDRTELIVLMRATVLETPEAAAISAATEKAALPGLQQAEKEFADEDKKAADKAAKKKDKGT